MNKNTRHITEAVVLFFVISLIWNLQVTVTKDGENIVDLSREFTQYVKETNR